MAMNKPTRCVRTIFRACFFAYTLALLTATHWPGLAIHGPIDRTDLVIHAGAFFWWTVLLYGAGLIATGERCGCGCFKRRIVWTAMAGIIFAVFDEKTQPIFGRVEDWTDMLADSCGVLVACVVISVWWSFLKTKNHLDASS